MNFFLVGEKRFLIKEFDTSAIEKWEKISYAKINKEINEEKEMFDASSFLSV